MAPEPARADHVRARHRTAPVAAAKRVRRRYRYRYLRYKTLVGAQMRYTVHARDGTPLAMLGSTAWTLAPRDRFIGWSRRRREKNLPLVVDSPRFLGGS